jgi:hypothetical protein
MNVDLNAPATVYAQIPLNEQIQAKRYIGSHLSTSTIKDEEYFGSCDNANFRIDRSDGRLKKVTLYEGTLSECRSLEHQLLVRYNAATNPNFYNSSNGGGVGVNKDYKHDPEDFQRMVDIIDGKTIVPPKIEVEVDDSVADTAAMELLVEEVKSGVYPVQEVPVSVLSTIDKSQVRLDTYNKNHLNELKLRFTEPALARMDLTPVSVIVDEKGKLVRLVDGNHRLKAAEHNHWVTIPAYIIPEDRFKDNYQNIIHYGSLMNHRKTIYAGNNNDDLKKRVDILAAHHPEKKKNSSAFKRIAVAQLGGLWPKSSIHYYCNECEKKLEEERLCKDTNFQNYERSELTLYANELHFQSTVNCVVEVQTVAKITGAGFGGIQVMMSDAGVKKGIVLVHYPTYTIYKDREKYISRVQKALEFFNFKGQGFDIELKFLDPFIKGKIVGLSE